MTKLYSDLENDDLIDQLIRRNALSGRTRKPSAASVTSVRLAGKAPVAQDLSMSTPAKRRQASPVGPQLASRRYEPLASVWYGEGDAELIEQLLLFYPHREPRLILDATVNGRRFWRGSTRPVVGLDNDSRHRPDICADNGAMPFRSNSFDVVVYDPPHIPNQGQDRSKDFNTRFGLGARSPKENGYTFSHTYPAFMREARRVLSEDGVLFCKIVDYVHNHRYQWAHIDLIRAGQDAGFTACDCIIKVRKGPIVDPKWKRAHHSRRQHCYWIVFRESPRCE
ncbi:MAG TPA: hypothetical protein VM755_19965 [Stellaceae bacterium]|nr:hypothetical protein [Stellaceae bacterium]